MYSSTGFAKLFQLIERQQSSGVEKGARIRVLTPLYVVRHSEPTTHSNSLQAVIKRRTLARSLARCLFRPTNFFNQLHLCNSSDRVLAQNCGKYTQYPQQRAGRERKKKNEEEEELTPGLICWGGWADVGE